MAQTIDESVGEVLDYLEANNLDRNTIIIYASDQGFFLGEHEWWNKQWMYEESLSTPLLMQWKDGDGNSLIRPGSQVDEMVQVIDYGPTLLEAAGVSPSQPMHGESFLGLVTSAQGDEPAQWRDSIYYRYYQVSDNQTAPHYGVRNGRHKLIYFYPVGEWELFDLDNDPHELNNLLDGIDPEQGIPSDPEMHELVVDLMTELRDLRTQYGDTEGPGFSIPDDL